MTNPTPRPWRATENADIEALEIPDYPLALLSHRECFDAPANARLIVRAVNCHDALVDALRACKKQLEDEGELVSWGKQAQLIDDALAKVEGQS